MTTTHFHINYRTESGAPVTDCQRFETYEKAQQRIRQLAWAKYEEPLVVGSSALCAICRNGGQN